MNTFYKENTTKYKLSMKLLSAFLAVLMIFSGGIIECFAAEPEPTENSTENVSSNEITDKEKETKSYSTGPIILGVIGIDYDTIWVFAKDDESGIAGYSFDDGATWQEHGLYKCQTNVMPMIAVKNNVGRITHYGEPKVDIDITAPNIKKINQSFDSDGRGTITITAYDDLSGIDKYSFDGGETWQSNNSERFDVNSTAHIKVKDKAENVLDYGYVDILVDTNAPVLSMLAVVYNGDGTISVLVGARDDISGIAAYSYDGGKTWTENYIYKCSTAVNPHLLIRDKAGNILDYGHIANNIDSKAPIITNVTSENNTDGTVTYTVTAYDEDKDVKSYSFDGGKTWQESNTYICNSNFTPKIAVKDMAGNVAYYMGTPATLEVYEENNLVYISAPVIDNGNYEYKLNDGDWTKYTGPFPIPANENVTVSARTVGKVELTSEKTFKNDFGSYNEAVSDMSVSYFGASFDFARYYDSANGWFNSLDSRIDLTKSNGSVIYAVTPDGATVVFEKSKTPNVFINKASNTKLTVTENDYTIKTDSNIFVYNADGVLKSISDLAGNAITFESVNGKITSVTAGESRTYTVSYNANGNIEAITNPLGEAVKYEYDTNGRLTKAYWDKSTFVISKDTDIILGEYSYNADGLLSKSLFKSIKYDSKGRVTEEAYDDNSYVNYSYALEDYTYQNIKNDDEAEITIPVIKVTTETSTETSSTAYYNYAFQSVSSSDENGVGTEYLYNADFTLNAECADSEKTSYTYDENGNVLTSVTENSNTTYTYDADGKILAECSISKDEDEKETKSYTKYEYDENGLIAKITQSENVDYSNGVISAYTSGVLTQVTDYSDKEKVTTAIYTYDSYGNTLTEKVAVVKDANASETATSYTYDLLGRTLTAENEDGKTTYTYNAAGNTIKEANDKETTRTIYDAYGRVIQSITTDDYDSTNDGLPSADTYADAKAGHTYLYASNGSLTSETNRLGKTTKYFYNDRGSKIREEFDIYKFYYLNHGETYQVKVAGVTTVSYGYDSKYNLVQETYANDDTIRYEYDEENRVTAQYKNNNSKPYITYTYNEDGELAEKINTDNGLKYIYGENGHVSIYKLIDNTLVQSYTEKVTEADEESNTPEYTTITENHFGKEYSSVVKDKSVSYTYGANSAVYNYETDADEKMTLDSVKFGNNTSLSSSYTYDDNDNVLKKAVTANDKLIDFVNTYDDKDRITSSSFGNRTFNYTYDEDSQLVATSSNNYSANYAYDSRGNILTKTVNGTTTDFTYANSGWKDQLLSVDDTELTYDEIGNITSFGNTEFTWNTGRNLESITDETNTYTYTYDENGIRTSKTVNGVTTYYNTSNGVILSQTDGANTMYFQYDTNGVPLGFICNNVQYFYITNQMGDVMGIADANGNEIAAYTYDDWGKAIEITGNEIASLNPIRYRGYYYDSETGYYYLQSRYYNPDWCRFINADIVEVSSLTKNIEAGTNLFAYCNDNPVNDSDFGGDFSISQMTKFLKSLGSRVWKLVKPLITKFVWKPGYIGLRIFEMLIDTAINAFCPTSFALKTVTYKAVNKALVEAAFKSSQKTIMNFLIKMSIKISFNTLFKQLVNKTIYKYASRLLTLGGLLCLLLDRADGYVDYFFNYGKFR